MVDVVVPVGREDPRRQMAGGGRPAGCGDRLRGSEPELRSETVRLAVVVGPARRRRRRHPNRYDRDRNNDGWPG
jgi:hypothetical protein